LLCKNKLNLNIKMIQQHFLQQQRLNYNFDRLLERQNRLLTPKISEFRPFGTSLLPGRNYDQYLTKTHGNHHRSNSLVAQSRARIGSSNETYRLMGDGSTENLPRNISSVVQHTRHHSMPLVHAEKFEPVKVYEHPVFGPTPAYLRPIYNHTKHLQDNYSDKDESESDEDKEVQPHNRTLQNKHKEQPKTSSVIEKKNNNNDDDDDGNESDYAPKGYISYKKWKAKYENLIPVNPLLYKIYTERPNGSIDSYGQALYTSPHRHRQTSGDDDLITTTLSDIGSSSSEIPHGTSASSYQKYHQVQPQSLSKTPIPRSLPPIHAGLIA
jgi:hypothetical protein